MKTFTDQLITALATKIETIIQRDAKIDSLLRDIEETSERSNYFFEKTLVQEKEIESLKEKINELENEVVDVEE